MHTNLIVNLQNRGSLVCTGRVVKAELVSDYVNFRNITKLYIGAMNCEIWNDSSFAATGRHLKHLEELVVKIDQNCSHITDIGLQQLASQLTSLRNVSLTCNAISIFSKGTFVT